MPLNKMLFLAGLACSFPATADTLSDALKEGKVDLQLRPRYEYVHQAGRAEDDNAFTMRTLLGYTTKPLGGLGASLQFINVSHLGSEDFNDLTNGRLAYPVVADAETTAVNQAFLSYKGLPSTLIRAGRQIIKLDNDRFIGNVDWRQNMQTYDGVSIENKSLPGTTLFAAYINRVKGSYANFQTPAGQNLQPVRLSLLNAGFTPFKGTTLSGYGYFYEDRSQPAGAASNMSSGTTGARLNGDYPLGSYKLLYTAEYARQLGYRDPRPGIEADYWLLGGGIGAGMLSARFDYEVLGANDRGTYGFQTPFATKHAFNGWADMFLATPATGLQDAFFTVSAKPLQPLTLTVMYHDFSADASEQHFGTEIDLLASYALQKQWLLGAKFADYSAGEGAGTVFPGTTQANVDTQKVWAFMTYAY